MNTSRRAFLASATTLGTLAVAASAAAPAPALKSGMKFSRPSKMKLGTVTYNLAKDWDVATLIKNCTEAKFQGVELRTTHAHKVEVNLSKA